MDNVQELETTLIAEPRREENARMQASAYLLELSFDWIVLRASENVHRLLGESHVTLIDEPLGRFVHSQAVHDLRNSFSRLSGTTGIGRAYGVRLTDDRDLVDIAFHHSDGRVLLEAVPCTAGFGESFGTVGGLIAGLADSRGQALLDAGARRMRALTGFDRVTLVYRDRRAESCRGAFANPAETSADLPALIGDVDEAAVPVFPYHAPHSSVADALLRAPTAAALEGLRRAGIRSFLRVPFELDGHSGEFRCDCRTPHRPSLELHAAAELFAQLFAMRLEIDTLRTG